MITRKQRFYLILLAGALLLLCCTLSMCTAQFLPRPDTDPAAWSAFAQTASTSRLMAFLAALTAGQPCNLLALLLIPLLLAFILWRGRPGAGGEQ